MKKIIGICGWIGSGKDTAADFLVANHGFVRESFAGTLKDAVSVVFGWDRELLEGKTSEARAWREQVDAWWARRLSMPHLTPRWVLQNWGTEVLRNHFHSDIWVSSLENKLLKSDYNVVISDCRFPNEIEVIKRLGGAVCWVERGDRPVWYEWAATYNRLPEDDKTKLNMRITATLHESPITYKIHPSEWYWVGADFDYNIDNNGSLRDLELNIKNLESNLPVANPV